MLPSLKSIDDYRRLRRDVDAQRPPMAAIAGRHRLPASELTPFAQGTHLVWGTRQSVIKVFIPLWPEDATIESALLERLSGSDIPVPRLQASGEIEGCPYVVMSRLEGDRIGDVWPTLGTREKERLALDAGRTMARLAMLPTAGLEWRVQHQDALLAERRPRLVEDQRQRGGDDALAAELQSFLGELPTLAPAESVLLHADLTDDHFLVSGGAITGVIDFADAFVGPWTYELAAPACFLTRADPAAQRAMLRGYGVTPSPELLEAVRAWAVLHRYGHLANMMKRAGAKTLREWLDGLWTRA